MEKPKIRIGEMTVEKIGLSIIHIEITGDFLDEWIRSYLGRNGIDISKMSRKWPICEDNKITFVYSQEPTTITKEEKKTNKPAWLSKYEKE